MVETTSINVRLPVSLRLLMTAYIRKDTHLNESDFIRDAIREKIRKDAPELYRSLFEEEE